MIFNIDIIYSIEKMAAKKYIIVLKDLNLKTIHEKYGLKEEGISDVVEKTTKIKDLSENPKSITFVDESKRIHNCVPTGLNFNSAQEYHCFWDHHVIPADSEKFFCPVKQIPLVISKTYHSEISKENNTLKERKSQSTFDSDGMFCSPNCVLAFIKENKHNILYNDSEILFHKMYKNTNPAPHWRMLKEYGGMLSINDFRNGFNKSEFINHGVYKPIAFLFEEKIKL